jgi:ABC-type antimicrobial peptide transport system permease subunit
VLAGAVAIVIGTIATPFLSSMLLPTVNPFDSASSNGFRFVVTPTTTAAVTSISISPELMLVAFGAAVLLGAVGSLYPAWRAARTRPAEAMRYE